MANKLDCQLPKEGKDDQVGCKCFVLSCSRCTLADRRSFRVTSRLISLSGGTRRVGKKPEKRLAKLGRLFGARAKLRKSKTISLLFNHKTQGRYIYMAVTFPKHDFQVSVLRSRNETSADARKAPESVHRGPILGSVITIDWRSPCIRETMNVLISTICIVMINYRQVRNCLGWKSSS
jgi:hypothetical protein